MNRPRTLVGSAVPLVLLIGLVGFVPAAAASGAPADDDDTRALILLRRAVVAATTLGYSGNQVVTSWHPDGGDTARLVAVEQFADGRRVETLRSATAERRSVTTRLGRPERELALRALDVLVAGYRLTATGGELVAGRRATVVTVQRGDGSVAARMWVDDETGLLLQQEVNDAAGTVLRMFTFTDVRVVPPVASAVPRQAIRTEPAGLTRPASLPQSRLPAWDTADTAGERQGWCADVECPGALVNGYRLLDVRRGSAGGASVVQLVYGDGLSSVSVFVQPGRLDPERLQGFRRATWEGSEVYVGQGWPTRLTWQGGERVFTAVGDAAPADLHAVTSTFPCDRAEPSGGAFATVGRGMRSVLEWLQGD